MIIIPKKNKDVRKINEYFRNIIKPELDLIKGELLLTETQDKIFNMKYVENKDIGFISDSLFISKDKCFAELKTIRQKIIKLL